MTDKDNQAPANVPTLIVWPDQTIAEARLAAGITDDTDVVIAQVRDCRRTNHEH